MWIRIAEETGGHWNKLFRLPFYSDIYLLLYQAILLFFRENLCTVNLLFLSKHKEKSPVNSLFFLISVTLYVICDDVYE